MDDLENQLRILIETLNLSEGGHYVQLARALNSIYEHLGGPAPWGDFEGLVRTRLEELAREKGCGQDAFQQAQTVFDWAVRVLEQVQLQPCSPKETIPQELATNPFLVAEVFTILLRHKDLWSNGPVLMARVLDELQRYAGYRPPIALEDPAAALPGSGERTVLIPLYLTSVGAAYGRWQRLLQESWHVLTKTPETLLERAGLFLDQLEVISVDPRVYDVHHALVRRPGHSFGEFDPDDLNSEGYYRRFVIRRWMLEVLEEWIADHQHEDLAYFEASVTLAGMMLLAGGMTGGRPGFHLADCSIGKLLSRMAALREEFFQYHFAHAPELFRPALERERQRWHYPFARVRQGFNRGKAVAYSSQHLVESLLKLARRAMHPELFASLEERCPAWGTWVLARCWGGLAQARQALEAGRPAEEILPCLFRVYEALLEGMERGVFPKPPIILAFAGRYPIGTTISDTISDWRVAELLEAGAELFRISSWAALQGALRGKRAGLSAHLQKRLREVWSWLAHELLPTLEAAGVAGPIAFRYRCYAAFVHHLDRLSTLGRSSKERQALLKALPELGEPAESLIGCFLAEGQLREAQKLLARWFREVAASQLLHPQIDWDWVVNALPALLVARTGQPPSWQPRDGQTEPTAELLELWELLKNHCNAVASCELVEALPVGLHFEDWQQHYAELVGGPSPEDSPFASRPPESDQETEEAFALPEDEAPWYEQDEESADPSEEPIEPPAAMLWHLREDDHPQRALCVAVENHGRFLQALARCWTMAAFEFPALRGRGARQERIFGQWSQQAWKLYGALVATLQEALDGYHQFLKRVGAETRHYALETSYYERILESLRDAAVSVGLAALCLGSRTSHPVRDRRLPPWAPGLTQLWKALRTADTPLAAMSFDEFCRRLLGQPLSFPQWASCTKAEAVVTPLLLHEALKRATASLAHRGFVAQAVGIIAAALKQSSIGRPLSGVHVLPDQRQVYDGLAYGVASALRELLPADAPQAPDLSPGLCSVLDHLGDVLEGFFRVLPNVRSDAAQELLDESYWRSVCDFVRAYGGELFRQEQIVAGNLWAALHMGVQEYLDIQAQEAEPAEETAFLVEYRRAGPEERRHLARCLETVYRCLHDRYALYREYIELTAYGAYGNLLYLWLDFLRLEARYVRELWRLSGLLGVYGCLLRAGLEELAEAWVARRLPEAESRFEHLRQDLERLDEKYGFVLPTLRDALTGKAAALLGERKLAERWLAAVGRGVSSGRSRFTTEWLALLSQRLEQSSRLGALFPHWLERLEEFTDRTLERSILGHSGQELLLVPGRPKLRLDEFVRQTSDVLEAWAKRLGVRSEDN
jgi:hypothetical protein